MKNIFGRAWDSFDVYLFDIDGTLINCAGAAHYFAFCHALKTLSGRELTLEGVVTEGNVDNGILRDALTLAGVHNIRWRERLPEIHRNMGDFVEAHQDELCATVLPQVQELLAHLRGNGAKLGVATGNLERIGKLKLQNAGLIDLFDFGGWSDAFEHRSEVFGGVYRTMREQCGSEATFCVVGDTPSDIRAAHDHGLPIIAVATGIYSSDQLENERPELCVRSFAELLSERQQL